MSLVTIIFLAVGLSVDAFSVAIGIGATNNHGYKPSKQALGTNSEASREISYPCLCGIIRLTKLLFASLLKFESHYPPRRGIVQHTNSDTLRFRNWRFTNKKSWAPVLRLSAAFGLFQFAMPIAGWLAGLTVVNIIGGLDHWIAFALLAYVGNKMIWDALKKKEEKEINDQTKGLSLLMLSIATSIDAFAVGFSFSLLKTDIILPALIIGVVCFLMTVVGMIFGKGLAGIFGKKVGIFGGVVLIVIGVKILTDHM